MKKRIFVLIVMAMFLLIPNAKAAGTASIIITPSSQTVIVGNTVTVTITVSASEPIAAIDYTVQYDSSLLTLTYTDSSMGGTRNLETIMNDTTYKKSYTYKFKARKSGTAVISISGEQVVNREKEEYRTSKNTAKIVSMTQEELYATYSKNNNLSSLGINDYQIEPGFNKDVTEYKVTLKPETEKIVVFATKEDNSANIVGAGEVAVSEGVNQIRIQVTAQNGNIKTYTITAIVPELDPIEVKVGDKTYTIVRSKKALSFANPLFVETTANVLGTDVPAFFNEATNTTIVGLKDSEGNIAYYIKNDENYTLFKELTFGNIDFMVIDNNDIPYSYKLKDIVINDITYKAYVKDDNSRFCLLYGINLSNGNKGFYEYDNYENSLQRFNMDDLSSQRRENNHYKKLIILMGGCSIILFIGLTTSLIFNIKNHKKDINKDIIKEEDIPTIPTKEDDSKDEIIIEKEIKETEVKEKVKKRKKTPKEDNKDENVM